MKIMKQWLIFCMLSNSIAQAVESFVVPAHAEQVYSSGRQKKKLFKSVGCEYTNHMIMPPKKDLIDACSSKYYEEHKVYIDANSEKYCHDVRMKKLAPMYLKFISPKVGYGVFAGHIIHPYEFIGVYAGELRPVKTSDDVDYAWYYTTDAPDGTRLIIDGKFKGNELRFINHDNNPNTQRIDVIVDGIFYVCYIATRYIPEGAQLTVDYGPAYWSSRSVDPESVV